MSDLMRRLPVEPAILLVAGAGSVAFLMSLLVICDNSFVHPDFYRYILPETLRNGLPIQWIDILNSLQLRSPGEFRPRFLAYFIQALDQKSRLFLYDYVLVLPTFSPISWILELFLGPFLVFHGVRNLTQDRRAAIAATIVYVSTIGFLSAFTMVLLQGKHLSNVVLAGAIYLASELSKRVTEDQKGLYQSTGFTKYLLLFFMFLGLFLDEMAMFVFFLIPLLFPELFSPRGFKSIQPRSMLLNGLFFGIPAFMFLAIVLFVVPVITEKFFGYRFDYLGNTLLIGENTRGAKSLLEGPYARFSWNLVFENGMTLFGVAAVPAEVSPFIKSAHGTYPGTQVNNVVKWIVVLSTIVAALALAIWGTVPARQYLRRTPLIFLGFLVFLSLLLVRHIPIATGYYYGAIFAVLFAMFVGVCYGAVDGSRLLARPAAASVVLFLAVVGASNFSKVNRGWIETHNETLVRSSFQSIVQLAAPRTLKRQELLEIWVAWKAGQLTRYLDETPISTGAVYLVAELQALDEVRTGVISPRHRLVNYTGY